MKTKSATHEKAGKGTTKPAAPLSVNGPFPAPHNDVLTLAEAAAFLRVEEEDVRRMAVSTTIPAKRIGNEWRFLKSALCAWLSGPAPNPDPEDWRAWNERSLSSAGAMADDETIPEMLEMLRQERKRHPLSEIQD